MAKKMENSEQDAKDVVTKVVVQPVSTEDVSAFWDAKKNDSAITDILKEYGMTRDSISNETKKALMGIIKNRRR